MIPGNASAWRRYPLDRSAARAEAMNRSELGPAREVAAEPGESDDRDAGSRCSAAVARRVVAPGGQKTPQAGERRNGMADLFERLEHVFDEPDACPVGRKAMRRDEVPKTFVLRHD